MKKMKIFLAIAFFMMLIILTKIVQAVEVTVSEYEELKNIIANENDTPIILSDNIVVLDDPGLTIESNKNFTLDLNGYLLSMESTIDNTSYLIQNKGRLTIKDSKENGKISYTSTNPDTKNSPTYASNTISNRGTIILESGKIENNTIGGVAVYCIDNYSNNALLQVNGGEINSLKSWGIRQFVTSNTLGNDVVLNGGTIYGGIYFQVANAEPKASLTINNGTIYR